MTREEAKSILEEERDVYIPKWIKDIKLDFFDRRWVNALELAIKALEQEPCEDCISRETARRIVDSGRTRQQMIDMILATPSVQPKPKIGHWIRVDKDKLKCSECDITHFIAQYPNGKIDFCPNCGAKMESEDKECR